MPLAKLPDIDIHYDIVGEGEPVLLVAGLGGAASYWAPNVPAFAEHHQVVLHDHRGTAKSTRWEGRYSVELMADDLLRLMDAIGIDKAHLVGHSTGGAIGQVLGAIAPDRMASLVLYATWAVRDPHMARCLEMRRRVGHAMGTAEYHRTTPLFLYPPYYIRDNEAALDAEIAASIANSTTQAIIDARITGILAFDGMPYYDRIRCPTMVLVTEDDLLTPPYASDTIAERIDGSELVKLPRGGHALSRSEPALFNRLVLDFLARSAMAKEAAHERA